MSELKLDRNPVREGGLEAPQAQPEPDPGPQTKPSGGRGLPDGDAQPEPDPGPEIKTGRGH